MIRGLAGVALALALLLPLGAGVLLLTGTWRSFRGVLLVGLATFTGLAAAIVLLPWLLYLGLSPSLPVVLLAGAVVLAAGVAADSRRPGRERGPRVGLELWPGVALAVPLVLLAVVGVDKPVNRYDAFANWALKAKLLHAGGTFTGALDERTLGAASIAPPVSRQFPIGLPAVEAFFLHGIGGANFRVAHLLFVLFLGGLVLTVWAFLRPWVGVLPLTAGLVLVLWMPAARDQALSDYADIPLACLFCAAALLVGLWLAGEGGDRLALASVFAAAALGTKRDAIAFCAVLFALAFVAVLVPRQPRRLRPLLLAGLGVALTAVPWRIFVATHGLEDRDVNLSVSRALGRADELPFVLRRFGDLFFQSTYLGVVPLAALAAIVLVARGPDRRLGVGVLALGIGLLAALAFVYLSGIAGVHYLLRTSAYRTLMTPTLLAAVLLPLLLTRALGSVGRR